ncbi:hypothetical protein C8Q78DRAFT_314547 [Trametes maxima]|nr:hypothetical protein C8Q78DRAFT_314547 [Trametes maxima]
MNHWNDHISVRHCVPLYPDTYLSDHKDAPAGCPTPIDSGDFNTTPVNNLKSLQICLMTAMIEQLPVDVREKICWTLVNRESPEDAFGTLATLARTCQALRDPALDVLWYTIPNIALLFRTLPSACYIERTLPQVWVGYLEAGAQSEVEVAFSSTFSADQAYFTRFCSYARRVRVFSNTLSTTTRQPLSVWTQRAVSSVYQTLAGIMQSRPLFPNVYKIEYSRYKTESTCLRLLVGPCLRDFNVFLSDDLASHSHESNDDEVAVLEERSTEDARTILKLKETSPRLKRIHIEISPASVALVSAVETALGGLKHLTSVSLSRDIAISPKTLAHLALSTGLESLECSLGDAFRGVDCWSLPSSRLHSAFPVLQQLCLTTSSLRLPTTLLELMRPPRLASIAVRTTDARVPRHDIDTLFSVIRALPSQGALKEVTLDVPNMRVSGPGLVAEGDVPAHSPSPICEETLEPLFALRGLTCLDLDCHCPFDVDDDLLMHISRAWPGLEYLKLGVYFPWGSDYDDARGQEPTGFDTPGHHDEAHDDKGDLRRRGWRRPHATLNGIMNFLQQCPAIQTLGVAFDADISLLAPNLRNRPHKTRGPPGRILQVLDVGLSPIGDPFAVAALLSNVFACVEDLDSRWVPLETEDYFYVPGPESSWSRARIYRTRWERVQELIPMFSSVRIQEQRWRDGTAHEIQGLPVHTA